MPRIKKAYLKDVSPFERAGIEDQAAVTGIYSKRRYRQGARLYKGTP